MKKYKGEKNWLGGEKTDWGEIPACYTGSKKNFSYLPTKPEDSG